MISLPVSDSLGPWRLIDDDAVAISFLAELKKEMPPTHPLFGRAAKALARRVDCDDVLFLTNDPERTLAVVHLTWKGSPESDPTWPITEFYLGWGPWIDAWKQEMSE